MTTLRGRAVPVLMSTLLLLVGANLGAFAATGDPLLLGRANTAGASTTVKNSGPGPALKLIGKANAPSLSVSSRKKVARLNADLLDGVDGSALASKVYTYSIPELTDVTRLERDLPGLPLGRYFASYVVSGTTSNSTGRLRCSLDGPGNATRLFTVGAVVSSMTTYVGASASGYVDVVAGGLQHLDCFYEPTGTFSTSAEAYTSQVTFVRVDQVVRKASAARP